MVQFANLDKQVSLIDQLDENDSPVVLVNVFNVDPEDADEVLKAWSRDADFMKNQPGYISTQIHQGIGNSSTYMNYAIWESVDAFKNAFENPEFQKLIASYPSSAVSHPHLFRRVGVPGICIGD